MSHYLTVYEPHFLKRRVGRDGDGGYVICDIDGSYDALISGGICDDISFEEAFLEEHADLECLAFDESSKIESSDNKRLKIVKKNIDLYETARTVNMHNVLKDYSNVFMKMDIEGGEDALFRSLSPDDLLKIKQLVIEFHSSYQVEIPTRLSKTHWLVHLHVNNWTANHPGQGILDVGGVGVPSCFECTYIRKNEGEKFNLSSRPIPDPVLDRKNVPEFPDISLQGWPFVN